MDKGHIPTISIEANTIPEAWEKTVLEVWEKGINIKTEYDKKEDPPSKDATVMITVKNPFEEPRIHKNFPGGPEELEIYCQEVLCGIHNSWISPEENKWTYTYNERLFHYSPCEDLTDSKSPRPFIPIDQIQYIIDKLSKSYYSRRAQAITWQPNCDVKTYDPPCLQRIWCRILEGENNELMLNMNTHWRSRDLYKAWLMNVIAITDLQKIIADKISKKTDKEVKVGRYVDISDSLHLYGSYFEEIKPEIKKMKEKPIYFDMGSDFYPAGNPYHMKSIQDNLEKRTYRSDDPAFLMITEETREKLKKDPNYFVNGNMKK